MKTTMTEEKVKELAVKFLAKADELNEMVSRYFDGSESREDERAYETVKYYNKQFIDAVNEYYGERDYNPYCLNYELAEMFI